MGKEKHRKKIEVEKQKGRKKERKQGGVIEEMRNKRTRQYKNRESPTKFTLQVRG